MSLFHSPNTIRDGVVVYFDAANIKTYPGSGTSLTSLVGGYTGTLVGGMSVTNKYMVFDGTDDKVTTTLDTSWNHTNAVTLTVSLKTSNLSQTTVGIIGKPAPDWEWGFYQNGADLQFKYWDTNGASANGMDFTSTNFFVNTTDTILLQYVWDGYTSYLYKNGALVTTHASTDATINQNRTNYISIGQTYVSSGTPYWSGAIQLVKIHNRILTSYELALELEAYRSRYGI